MQFTPASYLFPRHALALGEEGLDLPRVVRPAVRRGLVDHRQLLHPQDLVRVVHSQLVKLCIQLLLLSLQRTELGEELGAVGAAASGLGGGDVGVAESDIAGRGGECGLQPISTHALILISLGWKAPEEVGRPDFVAEHQKIVN